MCQATQLVVAARYKRASRGVDIQYEYRAIQGRDGESGFRMVFWFDALFALKVIGLG